MEGCSYHVFLSFRGEDTRKSFVDHLYTALVGAGICTFRDNEGIQRGENIKSELEKGILHSRCSIVVLSQNYSSSTSCLDELVTILDRNRKDSRFMVLPIFYHVDPSDVRKQNGSFGNAFAVHESKKEEKEKVKRWRNALREVADLGGMSLANQADGHEAKFIEKVVKVIEERLKRRILSVPPVLVGMESRVKNINMWLQDDSTKVGIVAICGMSGIGKSTVAKYVFNLNFERFEAASFLANIREVAGLPDGLIRLQTQLLYDISKGKKIKIWNVDEGIIRIRDVLSHKKVLLVLDDVDHVNQFEAILEMRDYLHPGSKIIITARHTQSLPYECYKIHHVKVMDFDESITLFSWYAFGQDYPFDAYAAPSRKVVANCGGLPLALKVLGSSLRGKEVDVWKNTLEKLELIPDHQIFKKLVISYESLPDDHDKNLFLEIVCFFIGKDKDYVITVLDGCGYYAVVGIQDLVDQCLLTIDRNNKVTMHQMIRDMGREVIRQESPKEPGKRTRLWRYKDSFHVLSGNTGTETITGLTLDMKMVMEDNSVMSEFATNSAKRRRHGEFDDHNFLKRLRSGFFSWLSVDTGSTHSNDVYLTTGAFSRMRELSVLEINYAELIGDYKNFPKKLKWLCWRGYPKKYVPTDFPFESLVVMDMRNSCLQQVWKGYKFLGSLKVLNLSHSHELISTPNFSSLPQLEYLILKDCTSLIEVHESIGNLETKLVVLNLRGCRSLRRLPRNICKLKVLETLILSGCLNLEELPQPMTTMESLKVFGADGIDMNPSSSTTPIDGLWQALGSRWVSILRKCPKRSFNTLPESLKSLTLSGCNLNSQSFPKEFSNLLSLKELDLSFNPFCSLPDSIRGLTSLQFLKIYSCTKLQEIIDLPGTIQVYAMNCTSLKKITYQSDVQKATLPFIGGCKKLVELEGCFKIETIRNQVNSLGMYKHSFLNGLKFKMLNIHMITEWEGYIQGLFEPGILNVVLAAGMVQECFNNVRVEYSPGTVIAHIHPSSNINIHNQNVYKDAVSIIPVVPSTLSPDIMIRGLNVYVVYTCGDEHYFKLINTISSDAKDLKVIYGRPKPN